jgi:hypothetical protein
LYGHERPVSRKPVEISDNTTVAPAQPITTSTPIRRRPDSAPANLRTSILKTPTGSRPPSASSNMSRNQVTYTSISVQALQMINEAQEYDDAHLSETTASLSGKLPARKSSLVRQSGTPVPKPPSRPQSPRVPISPSPPQLSNREVVNSTKKVTIPRGTWRL